jgi:putative transposase
VYCGDDMAPEINRRLSAELASGRRKLPTLREYVESFRRFIDAYHSEPMDVLGGRTPAQVWAELTPVGVSLSAEAVMRPAQECTVGRQTVRLHNRFYFHDALALYDGHKVQVEYDLHTDGKVWVHDSKGRLICEAKLVNTIGVLPSSRLEEQRDKRAAGQLKRLQKHVDEVAARRADPVTAEAQVAAMEALEALAPALQGPTPANTPTKALPTLYSPPPADPASPEAERGLPLVERIDITDWSND